MEEPGVEAGNRDEPLEAALEAEWQRIRRRMEASRHLLAEQGSFVSKAGQDSTCWRLRFFERTAEGRRVQRSIQVGEHPELVRRARTLLASYRRPKELARETAELVRHALSMMGLL